MDNEQVRKGGVIQKPGCDIFSTTAKVHKALIYDKQFDFSSWI